MARIIYPFVLCLALVALATMWLRPGIAQELLALAQSVRAQSPDPAYAGTSAIPPGYVPYSNTPGSPTQPLPATRPATWPGAPAPSGVKVWDPSPQRPSAPPIGSAPANTTILPGPAVLQPPSQFAESQIAPQQPPFVQPQPQFAPGPPQFVQAQPQVPPPQGQFSLPPAQGAPPLLAPTGQAALPPATVAQEFTDAKVVAKVGSEVILASDVKAFAHAVILQRKMEIPPEQIDEYCRVASRPLLKQMVETKLVFNDAVHTVPAAGLTKIQGNIAEGFDKEELPPLMKAHGVSTRQELDAKLRNQGSSLDWERRAFFEKTLCMSWIRQQIKLDEEIPLADVLGYYEQHLDDYKFQAQARWEELMASFDRYPDKASAWRAIAEMGLDVQRGVPFADVARARSQGATASDGGLYNWTTQGSLVAKKVDEEIFTLPVGRLSQILDSERGFHIVRVVERKAAGKKPFEEAQGEIKKRLKDESREKQVKKYLDDLRKRTPIWSMYDNEPGGLDGLPQPRTESNF